MTSQPQQTPSPAALIRQVRRLISQHKHIRPERLCFVTTLHQELGFDTVDVVDIILAVERRYQVIIPDDVPLRTVGDFVAYLDSQLFQRSTQYPLANRLDASAPASIKLSNHTNSKKFNPQ